MADMQLRVGIAQEIGAIRGIMLEWGVLDDDERLGELLCELTKTIEARVVSKKKVNTALTRLELQVTVVTGRSSWAFHEACAILRSYVM